MPHNRSSLARVYHIHSRLEGGEYPSAAALAAEFEVSTRTVKREIEAMRDRLGLPIEYSYQERGYFYGEPVDEFPVFEVKKGELASLFLFKQSLKSIEGSQLAYSLSKVFEEMSDQITGEAAIRLHDLDTAFSQQNVRLRVGLLDRLEEVSQAMLRRHPLHFEYKKLYSNVYESRTVNPYQLREVENCWYLIGYDHSRQAVRTFAVPRMKVLSRDEESKFEIPKQFLDSSSIDQAFGSWVDTDEAQSTSRVSILLTGYAAQQAIERVWHASQEVEIVNEGEVKITFLVRDFHELVRWTLSWGRHAKVLGPKSFQEDVNEEYRAMQHD